MKRILILLASCCVLFACSESLEDSGGDSGTGGSMARFACVDDHLYVVDGDYLKTFDISDSSRIVPTSRIAASWSSEIETIFPADSLLFLGSRNGMHIYSIKTPAKPDFIYRYEHVVSCDPVVVQGKYAYVTMRTDPDNWSCNRGVNELEVIDLSNILQPQSKGVYSMLNPRGLSIDGNLLFVCDGVSLIVFDSSNPLALTRKKQIDLDATPYDVIAKNGVLVLSYANGFKQYSYSNDTIQELSTLY